MLRIIFDYSAFRCFKYSVSSQDKVFGKLGFSLLRKDELHLIATSLSLRLYLVIPFCKGRIGAIQSSIFAVNGDIHKEFGLKICKWAVCKFSESVHTSRNSDN